MNDRDLLALCCRMGAAGKHVTDEDLDLCLEHIHTGLVRDLLIRIACLEGRNRDLETK